jgi:hypothetical protein
MRPGQRPGPYRHFLKAPRLKGRGAFFGPAARSQSDGLGFSSLFLQGLDFKGDIFPTFLFDTIGTLVLTLGQIGQFAFHFPVVFQPVP